MRYTEQSDLSLPRHVESEGLHFMLNFTVALALLIGVVLWQLGRRGRVLWLKVWSLGLMLASLGYLLAAANGMIV